MSRDEDGTPTTHECTYHSNDALRTILKHTGLKAKDLTPLSHEELFDKACGLGLVKSCCKEAAVPRGRHGQALKSGFLRKDQIAELVRKRAETDPSIDVDSLDALSKLGAVKLANKLGLVSDELADASSTVRHTTLKTYLFTLIQAPEVRQRLKQYVNLYSTAWKRGMWLANLVATRLVRDELGGADGTSGAVAPAVASLTAPRLYGWLSQKALVGQCFVPELNRSQARAEAVHPVLRDILTADPTAFMGLGAGMSMLNASAWGQVRNNMADSKFLPHVQTHVTTHLWARIKRHLTSHHPVLEPCFGAVRSSMRPLAVGEAVWDAVMAWRQVAFALAGDGGGGDVDQAPDCEPPQSFEMSELTVALHAWLYLRQPFVDELVKSRTTSSKKQESGDGGEKKQGDDEGGVKRFDLLPLSGGIGRVHSYVDLKVARCLFKKQGNDLRKLVGLTSAEVRAAWSERRRRLRKAAREQGRRNVKGAERWAKRGRGSVPADETSTLRSFETDGVAMSLSYELKVLHRPHPFVGVVDRRRKNKGASDGTVVLPYPKDAGDWPDGVVSEPKVMASGDLGRAKVITMAVQRLPPLHRPMTDEERIEWAADASIFMLSRRMLRRGMKQHRQRAWQDRRIHQRPGLREALQEMADAAQSSMSAARHGYDGLVHRLQAMSRHWRTLKEEYLEGESADEYGKWRMTLFRGKRATIDRFIRKALTSQDRGGGEPPPPIELSIGAASFAATGKGEEAVPTSSMLREIIRVIRVHKMRVRLNKAVDEYLTTQVCYRSGERMTKVTARLYCCTSPKCTCRPLRPSRRPGATERYELTAEADDVVTRTDGRSVYRLANKAGRRRNRDVNAARNLLIIGYAAVAGQERPASLRRDGPNAKVRKRTAVAGGAPKKRKKREGSGGNVTIPTRLAPNS